MENNPKVVRRVISENTARKVTAILEDVTSPDGTAPKAAISGFRVAGKTGTSQTVDEKTKRYSKTKYVASFVGFAPVEKPRVVILISIDEPKGLYYGGIVAAPVFKEVGLWTLNHLGVSPQTEPALFADAKPVETQRKIIKKSKENEGRDVTKTDPDPMGKGLLPNFRGMGMREVLKQSRDLGLKVSLKGSGLAAEQDPVAGSEINQTKNLIVHFEPPT
jgi:cell division protein FtsI (penicillin-binding protein 3)